MMSSMSSIPVIQIGDIIEVSGKKGYKLFELSDIACWEKNHSIKTIGMVEQQFKEWNYQWSKRKLLEAQNSLRKKVKFVFKDGDKLLIKCQHDSVPYTISVAYRNSHNRAEITGVHFNKMMTQ